MAAFYEKRHGQLDSKVKMKVLAASAATIDRLLAPCRITLGSRGRCGTRPGTLLRSQIPIRTEHWEVSGPGFIEADTVAHCGQSMAGEFCWSITATDVHTQWTETRAASTVTDAVAERIAQIERLCPSPSWALIPITEASSSTGIWCITSAKERSRSVSPARELTEKMTTPEWNKRMDPCASVSRLRATGRRSSGYAAGRSLSPGVELIPQFLLPRYEAPAHRVQRQPQTAHLRPASHTLCASESLPPETIPNRTSGTTRGQADPFVLKEKIEQKLRAILRQAVRLSLHNAA